MNNPTSQTDNRQAPSCPDTRVAELPVTCGHDWPHHEINFFAGYANASHGRKAQQQSVKQAEKMTAELDRLLKTADVTETVYCSPSPDFFDRLGDMDKMRPEVWQTILDTSRIRWILMTKYPVNVRSGLPENWGAGYKNVCLGLMLGNCDAGAMERIAIFKTVPAHIRMLWVKPGHVTPAVLACLDGIHWLIVEDRNGADGSVSSLSPGRLLEIRGACTKSGVAFFHHRGEPGSIDPASTSDASDKSLPAEHPFGDQVNLRRAPLEKRQNVQAVTRILRPVGQGGQQARAAETAMTRPEAKSSTPDAQSDSHDLKADKLEVHADSISEQDGKEPTKALGTGKRTASKTADSIAPAKEIQVEVMPEIDHRTVDPEASLYLALAQSSDDAEAFRQLDAIVKKAVGIFVVIGKALEGIRDRNLWTVGGFKSWNDYCITVTGYSKTHANRLIAAANCASNLVTPIGVTSQAPQIPLPVSESQVRPLLLLDAPVERSEAWVRAAERAGGTPTAKIVRDVVKEMKGSPEPREKAGRNRQLVDTFKRLRKAYFGKRPQDEIKSLFAEFEKLLGLQSRQTTPGNSNR